MFEINFNFFFSPGQGYLQLDDKFSVGEQTKLTLDIKPRSKDGVILYAKSSNESLEDFLLLELVNGSLKATVNNGDRNEIEAIIESTNENCNGQWHSIELFKMANVIILNIGN